jgi:hypothetical protein
LKIDESRRSGPFGAISRARSPYFSGLADFVVANGRVEVNHMSHPILAFRETSLSLGDARFPWRRAK